MRVRDIAATTRASLMGGHCRAEAAGRESWAGPQCAWRWRAVKSSFERRPSWVLVSTLFYFFYPDRRERFVVEARGGLLYPATPLLELNPLGDLGDHLLKVSCSHRCGDTGLAGNRETSNDKKKVGGKSK